MKFFFPSPQLTDVIFLLAEDQRDGDDIVVLRGSWASPKALVLQTPRRLRLPS